MKIAKVMNLILIALCTNIVLVGCEKPETYRWARYAFDLPEKGGHASLDVRPAHYYGSKSEYRLLGQYGKRNFSVEPWLGRKETINLEWLPKTLKNGPFIRIDIHDPIWGRRIVLVDLRTGETSEESVKISQSKIREPVAILLAHRDPNGIFTVGDGGKTVECILVPPDPSQ